MEWRRVKNLAKVMAEDLDIGIFHHLRCHRFDILTRGPDNKSRCCHRRLGHKTHLDFRNPKVLSTEHEMAKQTVSCWAHRWEV